MGFMAGGSVAWVLSHDPQHRAHNEYTQQSSDGVGDNEQATRESLWVRTTTDPVALYTAVVGVFTGLLAFVATIQIGFLIQANKNAKIASNASMRLATASEYAMEAGNRAFVHYAGCRWISHTDISDGHIFWRIRPRWINQGRTPTRQLRVYVHYEFVDKPLQDDYSFVPAPSVSQVPGSIAPRGVIESGYMDYDGRDLVAISEGKKHLYIWGVARYRDVFKNTPDRITRFCVHAISITGDPLKSWHAQDNPVEIMFASHAWHNCSDEDCEQDTDTG